MPAVRATPARAGSSSRWTDDVMRLYGSERLISVFESLGVDEDTPIEHKMLTGALEQAQKTRREPQLPGAKERRSSLTT